MSPVHKLKGIKEIHVITLGCYMKKCEAKVKVCGSVKEVYGEHSHSDKLAKLEFKSILFDKALNELLSSVDISGITSDGVYSPALKKVRGAQLGNEHKRKKIKIIKTHRCNARKCK